MKHKVTERSEALVQTWVWVTDARGRERLVARWVDGQARPAVVSAA